MEHFVLVGDGADDEVHRFVIHEKRYLTFSYI
jgi:hypothetical protein